MIELVTLFLGLVVGPRPVEIHAVGAVAEVEVKLDGATVAVLEGPPWRFECDFGRLRTHALVAVARDASGRELSRAEQWVNVAEGSPSEASMVFASGANGKPVAVSLDWESVGQLQPTAIEVLFDGEPLEVEDPRYVPLPEYDENDFHFVSASLHFSDRRSHQLEASFGGARAGEISSELTAVPVVVDKKLPPLRKLGSWFLGDGRPLTVHGVEDSDPEVVVVRDPAVQPILDELARFHLARSNIRSAGNPWNVEQWDPAAFFSGGPETVTLNVMRQGRNLRPLQELAAFMEDTTVYFVSPQAAPALPAGVTPETFLHSESFTAGEGALATLAFREPMSYANQIVDAVAVGGMMAQAASRRRAVVLLLGGGGGPDHSLYPVEDVRRYLQELRVPLLVWTLGRGEVGTEWGAVRHLGDPAQPRKVLANLEEAVEDLTRELKRQRIVWLKGRYLPRSIELSPEARGIRLAGLDPP